jgi:hypothetical protein
MAASMAVPPLSSVSMAVLAAKGCDVAHIPLVAMTVDRPGDWKSLIGILLCLAAQ